MAHYFESGFAVRKPSWHALEDLLQDYPATWDEARVRAGITWEPLRAPSFGFIGLDEAGDVTSDPKEAMKSVLVEGDDFHAPVLTPMGEYREDVEESRIVRSDTHALLAVTSASRAVINHQEMGEAIEMVTGIPVFEGGGNVKVDTMGSVQGGKKVYATLIIDEPFTVFGDTSATFPMLTATNAHDSGSFRIGASNVRVVCANTFAAAESEQDGHKQFWSFRHTANWKDQIDVARQALKGVREEAKEYQIAMDGLAHMRVTVKQEEEFIQRFIGLPEYTTDRKQANALAQRQAIRACLASPTCSALEPTAYRLVQAAGEFLDHLRGTKGNKRDSIVNRQIISTNPDKAKAVRLAREVAASSV